MSAGDIVQSVGLFLTFVAVVAAVVAFRREKDVQRASFFKELYEPLFLDPNLRRTFDLIGKTGGLYTNVSPPEPSANQIAVERTFAHFEIICALHRRGLFTADDMEEFDFNMHRIAKAKDFGDYRKSLEDWRSKAGLERGPYSNFLAYVDKNEERFHPTPPR